MNRRTVWGLAALALAQWGLLTAGLSRQSLWIDEWFTIKDVSPGWPDFIPELILTERRPPLYWALLKLWMGLAGESEFALRLFSVLMAALLLAASFNLARRLVGPSAAAVAAGLLAFSPFLILFSRMLRSYSLFALLVTAATIALLRLAGRLTPARWGLYAGLAVLLIYTDYGALGVLVVHGLWLLKDLPGGAGRVLARLAALAVAGLAFAPWIGVAAQQSERSAGGLAADLAGSPPGLALKLAIPFVALGAGETIYPWQPLAGLSIAVCAFLAVMGARRLWAAARAAAGLLVGWFGVSVVFTATVLSLIAVDITFLNVTSRAPHLAVAYSLLIGAGLVSLGRRRWRAAALAVVGGAFGVALLNYFAGREFLNPIYAVPVRDVVRQVSVEAGPDELIIAEFDTLFGHYYAAQPGRAGYQDAAPEHNRATIEARRPGRVWLITFGRDRTAGAFGAEALGDWLLSDYRIASSRGYAEVGPAYNWVKERLLGRPAYRYKLNVTVYERRP